MNTVNNKRKKESQEKIEKAFVELIQTKEIEDISVTSICKITKLNRSTFYANYIDIYDLAEKIRTKMINDFLDIYKEEVEKEEHSYNFLKLFAHIKANQLFYKTYFKLSFDVNNSFELADIDAAIEFHGSTKNIDYHIEFFKAGFNAIVKKWLNNNCDKTPEEMEEIIKQEYTSKAKIEFQK